VDNAVQQLRVEQIAERLEIRCMEDAGFKVHPWVVSSDEVDRVDIFRFNWADVGPDPTKVSATGYDIQQGHRTDSVELSDWDLLSETDRRSYFKKRFGVDFTDAVIAESRSGTDRFGEPLEYAGMETIIMSDGERVHYYASGCAGEVRRRLFGDELSAYYELAYYGAQKKNAGALRLVMEFDEVKDADQAWGTCMAAAGFSGLADPVVDGINLALKWRAEAVDALGSETRFWDSPAAREWESRMVELAEQDVECNETAQVNEIRRDVFERELFAYLSDNEPTLREYHEVATDALTRGQELLAER
jgi:hypothetical protein